MKSTTAPSESGDTSAAPFAVLDKSDSTPIWAQLRDQIIDKIRTGALAYGEKMPTVRNLAAELGVSVSVVNQAYRYLRVTGYLESRQGSGVRVRRRSDSLDEENFPLVAQLTDEYVEGCLKLGLAPDEVMDTLRFYLSHRAYVQETGDAARSEYLDNLMGPGPSYSKEK